jgi:hypothetical protein
MSTASTPPAPAPKPAAPARREITLISHSMLFYWWPIWVFGFAFAILTWKENNRLAIVPPETPVDAADGKYHLAIPQPTEPGTPARTGDTKADQAFRTRVSHQPWMGPIFCVVLLLTVIVTNVPLRGLWSFLVLLMVAIVALLITLVPGGWGKLAGALGDLHIYINMAGYLFIAAVVFVLWAVSVFIFDQRTYMVVKPGQIQVCEHIGASIRVFDTVGMTFEKQRDDLFRHWLLGFFSGDLIVRTSGAERETIRLPNVLWIGWRLDELQSLLAEKAIVNAN